MNMPDTDYFDLLDAMASVDTPPHRRRFVASAPERLKRNPRKLAEAYRDDLFWTARARSSDPEQFDRRYTMLPQPLINDIARRVLPTNLHTKG